MKKNILRKSVVPSSCSSYYYSLFILCTIFCVHSFHALLCCLCTLNWLHFLTFREAYTIHICLAFSSSSFNFFSNFLPYSLSLTHLLTRFYDFEPSRHFGDLEKMCVCVFVCVCFWSGGESMYAMPVREKD
jgi:hypothetical protein